jgi:hypothetical protein
VAEVNWKTKEVRQLFAPVAQGAARFEITALYSVPPGIVIERVLCVSGLWLIPIKYRKEDTAKYFPKKIFDRNPISHNI